MIVTETDHNYIDPTARLFWVAHHFRIAATHTDRYELECLDGYENPRTLPKDKVRDLKRSGDLVVEPFYFDYDGKPAKSNAHIKMLAAETPAEVSRTLLSYTKARLLQQAYKAGKVALYETQPRPTSGRRRRHTGKVTVDVWMKQNEAIIQAACYPFYLLDPDAPKPNEKPRVGQLGLPALGSASKIKKDRAILARKNFKITDLCSNRDAMRRGGRRLAPDMAEFVEVLIRKVLLRPERITLAQFRRHVGAELKATTSMALRTPPSLSAIENLILTLDDAKVIAARFGATKAIESRTIYTERPEFRYPGELVLMDCWKIDLVACIGEQGGWTFVTKSELEEWGVRRRLWVSWVIDACSRSILGLALGLSESTELTTRALRMAVTDKSLQCIDAECNASPIPPIGIESLLTDIGGAFTHPYFMVPALSLVPDVDVGPGGKANLRGLLERFNRTVKQQMLAYFTGTTFGDVVTKGDYNSMERASADVQTLGRGLWKYINDVYNLSEHRGNDGQPPINRFEERFHSNGTADVYSEERIRIAFGREFNLPVTREGVCFASNHYFSGRLQTHFRDCGKQKLRAKIDLTNLGRISVWFEGEWHTLAGPRRMERIGFTDWNNTRRALSKRYGEQAAANADIVAKALRELEAMGTEARLKSQISDMSYSSEDVARAANKIRLRITEDETPMEQGRFLAFDASADWASFPASGSDLDAEAEIEAAQSAVDVVDDPYADAGPDVREESELGLDDADIDLDGDPIDESESEEPDPEPDPDPEAKTRAKRKPKRPAPQNSSPKPFALLPQPIRKSTP